jgi:hypothetical protein
MVNMIGSALNAAFAPEGASTEAEERAAKDNADWRGLAPTKIRTPWRDSTGSTRYLDLSTYFPLADLAEMYDGTALPIPVPKKLMPGGPTFGAGAELLLNEKQTPYGTQKITNKNKTRMGQAEDFATYFKQLWQPGTMYHTDKIEAAARGEKTALGQRETVLGAIANTFGKLPAANPKADAAKRAMQTKMEIRNNQAIVNEARRELANNETDLKGYQSTAVEYNELSRASAKNFAEYMRRLRAVKGAPK